MKRKNSLTIIIILITKILALDAHYFVSDVKILKDEENIFLLIMQIFLKDLDLLNVFYINKKNHNGTHSSISSFSSLNFPRQIFYFCF